MSGMSGTSAMDGMSISNMTMGASQMMMTFFNSKTTALYSMSWQPTGTAGYTGTCIFLLVLTIIYRSLFAIKRILENRWLNQAWNRRYIVVVNKQPVSEQLRTDPDLKSGVLTANGVEEHIKVVHRPVSGPQPFRLSVDLPRAALFTVILGIGYLLMLAVMTYNVGYFLSILAGGFIGELAVGRYIQMAEEHH